MDGKELDEKAAAAAVTTQAVNGTGEATPQFDEKAHGVVMARETGAEKPRSASSRGGASVRDAEEGMAAPSSPAILPLPNSPSQSTRALTLRDDENFYPEGGLQAWLVVFGSWCALLAALGIMNTLASFQAYISRNQLVGYSEGEIGWIFSVYTFLSFGFGVFIGPIFDKFGARALMITGGLGIVAGIMLMSICTSMSFFRLFVSASF
jgi:hypothetical protein